MDYRGRIPQGSMSGIVCNEFRVCEGTGTDLGDLTNHLGRLYQRAVLPPKTNIGTLAPPLMPHNPSLRLFSKNCHAFFCAIMADRDTTRVIERLTSRELFFYVCFIFSFLFFLCKRKNSPTIQARLSRFHTTGAASMQQATNLAALLHPTQSTWNPQMIIRLF